MRLGRDTTIRLGEQARLKIDRFLVDAGGEMTLRSGPLLFDRPPRSARAGVQIRSPFALIAVRGTQFFAGPSNERFGVFVAHGSVVVTSAGQQVILREGEGTDFVSPGTPPTPVKRWAPQRIRAALASVS
jgi:ferric-dicitrate binding protein FerR (iron transport regulator)